MNLNDALRDNQLSEMALRDVNASLKKMIANKDNRLEKVLAGISPEQVAGWTEAEKQEYVQLVSNPFVQKIARSSQEVANVLSGIAKSMEAKQVAPAEEPAKQPDSGMPSAAPTRRAGGTVSSNDPAIAQMQKQYFAAKTPEAKKALTDKWNADPVASRRYLSGKKTGYFK